MRIKKAMILKKLPSYTMTEVLFVLIIIGIAVSVAIPILSPLTSQTRASEAQMQLEHISTMQTQYRYMHYKYSMSFKDIKFEVPKSVNEDGSAYYSYEIIEASKTSFKARAEAIVDFDGDGIINVWEIDENGVPKEIVED